MKRGRPKYLRNVDRKGQYLNLDQEAGGESLELLALRSAQGHRLRRARQARRLSFQALADACGVSSGLISKWERGLCFPKPEVFDVLKAALGVSVHFLVMGDEELEVELLGMMPASAPGEFLSPEEAARRTRIAECAAAEMQRIRQEASARSDALRARKSRELEQKAKCRAFLDRKEEIFNRVSGVAPRHCSGCGELEGLANGKCWECFTVEDEE
jgi:transcriptional regulator with XRE-family HTH domain